MFLQNLEIAALIAAISLFVNYCLGKPGSSEFSPYEIFSFYTVWLSRWRLKRLGSYEIYESQFDYKSARSESQLIALQKDAAIIVYNAAEPFFTWERALGMCVICTGFWVSLGIGLLFTMNFLYLIEIIVFSHIIIRILAKII